MSLDKKPGTGGSDKRTFWVERRALLKSEGSKEWMKRSSGWSVRDEGKRRKSKI